MRRFWARRAAVDVAPAAPARLYPYLARSPVRSGRWRRRSSARSSTAARRPASCARPRWRTTARAEAPAVAPTMRAPTARPSSALRASLPPALASAEPAAAQDQYLEVRTLLSGYLLSSQGDRMLMAQLGRGPLPVPRPRRGGAGRLAAGDLQAAGLDEKVLKRAPPTVPARSCGARSSPIARPTCGRSSGRRCPSTSRRCSRPSGGASRPASSIPSPSNSSSRSAGPLAGHGHEQQRRDGVLRGALDPAPRPRLRARRAREHRARPTPPRPATPGMDVDRVSTAA